MEQKKENSTEILCDKKYIVLPASFHSQKKRLFFYEGEKLVYDLAVSLDYENPDYQFPIDVQRFAGKTLRIKSDKDIDIHIEKTDEPVFDYSGKYRPLAHFTSMRGWINDPNGLVHHKGKYLMYFQHNPAATTWENMHWGSAVSDDLIHWTENGDVIFPDENGTVFSGSGIVDKNNVSGFGKDGEEPILFFYTRAGNTSEASKGKTFTQNLAYSLDGGKTLLLHKKPLIEQIVSENRDPKVIYYAPGNCFIMALFLENHEFVLFKSENLFDWNELQRISLADDAECPDFYPLEINGETKWIFSAASDRYYIGTFDGKKFNPQTEQLRLNYGNNSYAAQSWSDVPNGRRIRTAFAKVVIPNMPFGSCMNIPQEMSLKEINGKVKLCANPVSEIKGLYENEKSFESIHLEKNIQFKQKVNGKCCNLELSFNASASVKISLFGMDIEYDAASHQLKCDDKSAPVDGEDGTVFLRVIFDTVYAEIFADGGSIFMGMTYIQDSMLKVLTLRSDDAEIKKISLSQMKSFYAK